MNKTTIVWFRQDLRLSDNPALCFACEQADTVIPIYIWDPESEAEWAPGAASCWWLHHSLKALDERLRKRGSGLCLLQGDSASVLTALVEQTEADCVVWNRRYEPAIKQRDSEFKSTLREKGVHCQSFNGSLWWEPWELRTGKGEPYRVFTPMWKSMLKEWRFPEVKPEPETILTSGKTIDQLNTVSIDDLNLLPQLNWDSGFYERWRPGELQAQKQLQRFRQHDAADYQDLRDFPAQSATSSLSPHLHFGEVSPNQIVQACADEGGQPLKAGPLGYVRQLAWRDFSYQLMHDFPWSVEQNLMTRFDVFPWREDYSDDLRRWQQGQTGIPMVDAGMRELWHTGWMHNRVRMVVASFLTKNLLIPWQEGARWFWDTLVDADLANNSMGWQWVAGCGADAAPYFRVFNPVTQSKKFDAEGEYIRRWLPELAKLSNRHIHEPWAAPREVLTQAGVELGKNYPEPMVDLKASRQRALAAYDQTKTS